MMVTKIDDQVYFKLYNLLNLLKYDSTGFMSITINFSYKRQGKTFILETSIENQQSEKGKHILNTLKNSVPSKYFFEWQSDEPNYKGKT
jgi:hypothetical protein